MFMLYNIDMRHFIRTLLLIFILSGVSLADNVTKAPSVVRHDRPHPELRIRRTKLLRTIWPPTKDHLLKSVFGTAMTSDKKEMIYSDKFGHRVGVIDEFGSYKRSISEVGPGEGQIGSPFGVTVDDDGNIYIGDSRKARINKYSPDGTLLFSVEQHLVTEKEALGKFESGKPLNMVTVIGMAIHDGKIYAVENQSGTIQLYNKEDGKFLGYFKDEVTGNISVLGSPSLILIGGGKLYVGRSFEKIVNCYDVDSGKHLYDIGRSGNFIGAFVSVNGMCFDGYGNIVVADATLNSVQVFSKDDGSYMYHVGDEKAIPDKSGGNQRPYVKEMSAPSFPQLDSKGRLWIFSGCSRSFIIREFIDDDIWVISSDKPEGKSPAKKKANCK